MSDKEKNAKLKEDKAKAHDKLLSKLDAKRHEAEMAATVDKFLLEFTIPD